MGDLSYWSRCDGKLFRTEHLSLSDDAGVNAIPIAGTRCGSRTLLMQALLSSGKGWAARELR